MIELTEEAYDGPVAAAFVQDLLAELNERYAHLLSEDPEEPTDEDYLAEVTPAMVRRPSGVFVVAWIDGDPLGCGALRALDGSTEVGEIKRMFTRPAGRRRGLSRRVLSRLEEVAVELGYQRLQLETGDPQHEAVALYTSHGWQRIEPYGNYKDSGVSVCFATDLRPA